MENKVSSFEMGQTSECLYSRYRACGHLQGCCWALVVSAREETTVFGCDICTCALEGKHSCTSTPAFTSLMTRVTSDRKHPEVKTLDM